MTETFYGPWRLVVAQADSFPEQAFVISGSDNADGRHIAVEQPPVSVDVYGTEWTVDLQSYWIGEDPGWQQSEVRRAMEFVPFQGLTVTLNTHPQTFGWIGPYYFGMILTCISNDPSTNPIPAPNPPDFTLPEG